MKMTATVELEFESVGETTHNAMDQALIRGLEALKKGIERSFGHQQGSRLCEEQGSAELLRHAVL
jgi:hypothetical protein